MTPAGLSDAHLVATLTFDDLAAIQAAIASEEGQRAAGDILASGGSQMLMFEVADV